VVGGAGGELVHAALVPARASRGWEGASERDREKRGRLEQSIIMPWGVWAPHATQGRLFFPRSAALDLHFPWWVVGFGQQAGRNRERAERKRQKER